MNYSNTNVCKIYFYDYLEKIFGSVIKKKISTYNK